MKNAVRRIRGALGMGLVWALAGAAAGTIISLGFVVRTGSRPDAPFPIMLGALGFVAGIAFAGVLRLVEGRRGFDQMSVSGFAVWGGVVGLGLSATFFLAVSRGNVTFLRYFLMVGPFCTVAAAGLAAGSLALARRADDRALLGTPPSRRALPSDGRGWPRADHLEGVHAHVGTPAGRADPGDTPPTSGMG